MLVFYVTSVIVGFLSQNLKVQEPGLQPGHHEGGDGQNVAEGIFGEKLRGNRGGGNFYNDGFYIKSEKK